LKIGYWVELNHKMDDGSIIARVSMEETSDILYEVEILKIFYVSGRYATGAWDVGSRTAITKHDLPDFQDSIKFIFERMT
jgi:hypothetical protein